MKKCIKIIFIGLLFFIMVIVLMNWISDFNSKYPRGGKDDMEVFGDGRYGIIRYSYWSPTSTNVDVTNVTNGCELYDKEKEEVIERVVFRYIEIKPCVYVVGVSGYTVVDCKTGQTIRKKDLKDLPAKEQKIFEDEKKFKKIEKELIPQDLTQ